MKTILTIIVRAGFALLLIGSAKGQIYIDTIPLTFPKYTGPVGRVNNDTFAWTLYKIKDNQYHYFRLISYSNIDSNGWSYAIWQAYRELKEDRFLYPGSHVYDTIPQVQRHTTWDEEKKMHAEWDEWWIGGIFGILARRSERVYINPKKEK